MLIRLVKLEIHPQHAADFEQFFAAEARGIRQWPGCLDVEAYRDINQAGRFFTRSCWQSQEALDAYRVSDFFRGNWKTVKAWFAAPAEAWSTEALSLGAVEGH
jgi:heme oxygenase (mycobilin-producing)